MKKRGVMRIPERVARPLEIIAGFPRSLNDAVEAGFARASNALNRKSAVPSWAAFAEDRAMGKHT